METNGLPWCAVNPANGLLYTSPFYPSPLDTSHLEAFARSMPKGSFSIGFQLRHVGRFDLLDESGRPLGIARVQGGAFSPGGHLYLVSDTADGGILGFDLVTGRKALHHTVAYNPDPFGPDELGEELEGITVWDLDSGTPPGIGGQLHVLMIDNELLSDDDLYFKHFRPRRLAEGEPSAGSTRNPGGGF